MSQANAPQKTSSGNRLYISFFGRCNVGKSSLVNALAGQEVSLVSPTKGTTSDPVRKSMELLPLGPIVLVDTAGLDETGGLGSERGRRSMIVLRQTDLAVLVLDAAGMKEEDELLLKQCRKRDTKYLVVRNLEAGGRPLPGARFPEGTLELDALKPEDILRLKEALVRALAEEAKTPRVLNDLLEQGDVVIFVAPIDSSAPAGRLILPQVQSLRDALDWHAISLLVQPEELPGALACLKNPPKLVVCDSQVFGKIKDMVPADVSLTSFSILFARLKGILPAAVRGAYAAEKLKPGAKVLIAEGCTHHRQCEDIGTVKLPRWIEAFAGKGIEFEFVSGGDFPASLKGYDLVVHCGGCMLNAREVLSRCREAGEQDIPFTNYGILIAHMNGILKRSVEVFGL